MYEIGENSIPLSWGFAMISAFAEFERAVLVDRVHAGLRRARAQGKILGGPRVTVDSNRVRALRQRGLSLRQIAKEMSISKDAAMRVLALHGPRSEPR